MTYDQQFIVKDEKESGGKTVRPVPQRVGQAAGTGYTNTAQPKNGSIATAEQVNAKRTQFLMDAPQHRDVFEFAYFLWRMNYYIYKADNGSVRTAARAYFCNIAKKKPVTSSLNSDRLHQMYVSELFTDEYTAFVFRENERAVDYTCTSCSTGKYPQKYCPYFALGYVLWFAKRSNLSPEQIFTSILGRLPVYRLHKPLEMIPEVPLSGLDGIDAESAYGAMILLETGMLRVTNITGTDVTYSYVDLWNSADKEPLIEKMQNFRHTGSGISKTVHLDGVVFRPELFNLGMHNDKFRLDPGKLAAFFVLRGRQSGIDPVDYAYRVANARTYYGLNPSSNYQFDRFISFAEKAPFLGESKLEFVKMVKYVVARSRNKRIPYMPFNCLVLTDNKEAAADIAKQFGNCVWYYKYINGANCRIREIDCSVTTVQDALKFYEENQSVFLHITKIEEWKDAEKKDLNQFCKELADRKEQSMTMISGTNDAVGAFLEKAPDLRKIFLHSLSVGSTSGGTIADNLIERLEVFLNIDDETRGVLRNFVDVDYQGSSYRNGEYEDRLYEKLLFNHYNDNINAGENLTASDIPSLAPKRTEKEIFGELDSMIGLANVKEELHQVASMVKFNIRAKRGTTDSINLHMAFTGNPGTGKTTVARLVAEIFYSIGYIKENKLVTCSAKDLVGQYLGQTAPKTAGKCQEAYNGVLFIDEAYQLIPGDGSSHNMYNEECVNELIQQMENNRDKLIVIFAGYTREMQEFMEKANSGLKSRIGKVIEFPDYTMDELMAIFYGLLKKNGFRITEGADRKVREILEDRRQNTRLFGNARDVRNIYEAAYERHAARFCDAPEDDPYFYIITQEDIR